MSPEVEVEVDVHTHLGEHGTHVHAPLAEHEIRAWGRVSWDVTTQEHAAAANSARTSIVLAFDAEPVGVVVPNDYVAAAVAGQDRLIGFASVNPNRPDAAARLETAVRDLGLRGLKLGPTYQHFHPHDRACLDLLEVADHYRLPVIWHQGTTFTSAAIAEYARPVQLDLAARTFPNLPMWIAHFGHPWMAECVATARRHEHFFIDVSALDTRPWQLAQALAAAYEYRIMDRILFGSDYPFSTVERTVAGLRRAAALCRRLGIAEVTDDDVDAICRRDALSRLGLRPPAPQAT
ncbi:amidohydrolase family protein [Dactylosporangium sp. NPDC051541]|uniref:amidohydrolase family protein n=1 Tax=Dactylosporangium sp. NPDC051541 TaxID=3363977 RepID=UPI0037921D70